MRIAHVAGFDAAAVAWNLGQAIHLHRVARLLDTYRQLKKVYESKLAKAAKLDQKAKIIDALVADLKLRRRPNNATLTEARVYNGGVAPLIEAHRACGDLRALVTAGRGLKRADFATTLQEDLAPIGKLLGQRCKQLART